MTDTEIIVPSEAEPLERIKLLLFSAPRRCSVWKLRSTISDTRWRRREPGWVLANHRGVAFALARPTEMVECVITIATLEAHFWLEPQASDARIPKTFRDGFGRIRPIAERKLLAHPATKLELTPHDFARP